MFFFANVLSTITQTRRVLHLKATINKNVYYFLQLVELLWTRKIKSVEQQVSYLSQHGSGKPQKLSTLYYLDLIVHNKKQQ